MRISCFFISCCLAINAWVTVSAADAIEVKSPDGNTVFHFSIKNGSLFYNISFNNSPVIAESPVILSLNGKMLVSGISMKLEKNYKIDETYPWLGVHAKAVNRCNGTILQFSQDKFIYTADIRVFNDGIAFRFIMPGRKDEERIIDETTVFNLVPGSMVWYHDLNMHYEGIHQKKEIAQIQEGEWVAPPATIKLPNGVYASITEADLQHYSGFSLQANGKNGLVMRLAEYQPTSYPYKLRYSPEDTLRLRQAPVMKGDIITPWRVVMIGRDLNTMVNNDMLHNLCDPPDKTLFPQGMSTDWIRPGRAIWKYLNGGGDGTVEVMKKFTDGAAALGFEHNILEGFWSRWTDEQIRDLVSYARERHVDTWVWKHSRSLRSDTAREKFFRRCHDLGIRGVKIDFLDHEAKEVADLYIDILREAAKNKIMVDFHGANKPTGLFRTWPNELTREGVKGMESSRLEDRATHETTIPFTRFLAGPAEYTVMLFGERKKNTTIAHQVASAAILSAPMLTYAAHPDTILASPAAPLIKQIPAVWDETIVLPGSEIGKLAAFVRRKGNEWFIAVMNGPGERSISIPLSFLKNDIYKGVSVKDDAGGAAIMENKTYRSTDLITLKLPSGGGFLCRLSK